MKPHNNPRRSAVAVLTAAMVLTCTWTCCTAVPELQSIDGTGNNVNSPLWASVGQQFLRKSPAAYPDGIGALAGSTRASSRVVSNALCADSTTGFTNRRDLSALWYAWGQFLDHDMTLTDTTAEAGSIAVPTGDPWFDPTSTGTATIPMSRSVYDASTGVSTPRQQVNTLAAYIDASMVYGSSSVRAAALRTMSGGQLATSTGNLLPFNTAGLPNIIPGPQLFLAGDVRANENPSLAAVHTLFVREHNRFAAAAAAANSSLDDETLYQLSRRYIISLVQKITYEEFLPALLGRPLPPYNGYNINVNAGVATEFSTAAYRMGHSMLSASQEFFDNNAQSVHPPLSLKNAFFNSPVLSTTGIDPVLKYLATDRAQEIDPVVIDDVRNFLFGAPGQGGLDLAALNIQRGRDHGLADLNTVRTAYNLLPHASFAALTSNASLAAALEAVYGSVNDVDLWVGGLAEDHLPESSLGSTFTAIVSDQFMRTRAGDRFWFQNLRLPPMVDQALRKTKLVDVIRRNTGITNIQNDVFFFRTSVNGSVFVDGNSDGVEQPLDPKVPNAAITLADASGTVVATARSGVDGKFLLRGQLSPGQYVVTMTPPLSASGAPQSKTVSITRGGCVSASFVVASSGQPKPSPPPPRPPRALRA